MPVQLRRLGPYPAYLILEGGYAFAFNLIVTVNLVWQAQVAGLDPLQLVLVGTVLETTALLAEVPTGVVADVYSRKLSIIIGLLLNGLGFLIEGLFPRFEMILLDNVIWGIGATFLSGATQAWISDEIGEAAAGPAFLRATQLAQLCSLVAIPASVALANVHLNVPILAGAVLMVLLGLSLALAMPETGFVRQARASHASLLSTLKEGSRVVRGSPLLITLLILAAFFGMASEGFDRLYTPHFLNNFELPKLDGLDSVTWFGVIRMGGVLLAIGVAEGVRRRIDTSNGPLVARVLFVSDALRIGSVLLFAITTDFAVALGAFWMASTFRRLNVPIYTAWVNQQLESSSRATVLSMAAQVDALGQIVGGPAVGALANVSLRAAFVATAMALAPALALYARAARQARLFQLAGAGRESIDG